jgi:Flp pilus assembly protein TadD
MPEAQAGLGRVAAQQGQWRKAVTQFAAAYGYMPSDPALLNDYGYAVLMTGQPAQAFVLLARAHELKPDDARIRTNYLLAAARAGRDGDVEEALASLNADDRRQLRAFLRNGAPVTPTLLERQRDSAAPLPPLTGPEAARVLEGGGKPAEP